MINDDDVAAPAADEACDVEVGQAELEAAACRHLQASCDWLTTCRQLRVDANKITPEHLTRATLSLDPGVQVARLDRLFRSCGLREAHQAAERSDLVAVIAGEAPRDEHERQVVYQSAVARSLAMFCAEKATEPGKTPQVTALLSGSFQKLSSHSLALDEKLDALRGGGGAAPRDVIGHLHVHTTAAVSSRGFYVGDSLPPDAPDTPSIRGEWCDAVDGADNADASRNQADGEVEGGGCEEDAP